MPRIYSLAFVEFGMSNQKSYRNNNKTQYISNIELHTQTHTYPPPLARTMRAESVHLLSAV